MIYIIVIIEIESICVVMDIIMSMEIV